MTTKRTVCSAALLCIAAASSTHAQATPAPPRTPPMILTTNAWPDGQQIPIKYTQAGEQVSPELKWTNVPAAAATGPLHHYTIEVYALDTKVDVTASTNAQPVTAAIETRTNVMKAMQGHVLGKAAYVGLFRRPQ